MDIESLRIFCLTLKGAEEKMPFDDKTLVFSVFGKCFVQQISLLLIFINVKCDPEEAIGLREMYRDVTTAII